MAERERIARELHDTLLQGVQGLIWRFRAVANRIPQPEPVRAMMERALDRADQMLGEVRDRVKELRATGGEEVDLSRALATEGDQLVLLHPAHFQMRVEGTSQELQPIVSEEVMFIAREALRNAIQHSGAQHIEAKVAYRDSALHVSIRDDGEGICEETRNGGKPGHFGLLGMRERAEKIRAQVKYRASRGRGPRSSCECRRRSHIGARRPRFGGSEPRWHVGTVCEIAVPAVPAADLIFLFRGKGKSFRCHGFRCVSAMNSAARAAAAD